MSLEFSSNMYVKIPFLKSIRPQNQVLTLDSFFF